MDQNQVNQEMQSQPAEQEEVAVPYKPPPPPEAPARNAGLIPYMNGAILAAVILLGGFIVYNFVGTQLTQLAGQSTSVTPTSVVTPTEVVTPTLYP